MAISTAASPCCQITGPVGAPCVWRLSTTGPNPSTWALFLYTEASLLYESHLDVKLQCCSCFCWHVSSFSWQFLYSCGVILTWIPENLDRYITLPSLKLNLSSLCPPGFCFCLMLVFYLFKKLFCLVISLSVP